MNLTREQRIRSVLSEVEPRAVINEDAILLLDKLVTKTVVDALTSGWNKADERNSQEIRICDLRHFIQDQLNLDVLGFNLDDLVDEAAVGSRIVLSALRQNDPSKRHLKRLAEKQQLFGHGKDSSSSNKKTSSDRPSEPDKKAGDGMQKKKRKKISKETG